MRTVRRMGSCRARYSFGMGSPARLRRLFSGITHEPPGERFTRSYERRRQRGEEQPARRWAVIGAGTLLFAMGLIMLVAPGPGIVAGLAGLALIARRSRRVATWMDRGELAIRHGVRRLRRR